jgi:hypothetical protein
VLATHTVSAAVAGVAVAGLPGVGEGAVGGGSAVAVAGEAEGLATDTAGLGESAMDGDAAAAGATAGAGETVAAGAGFGVAGTGVCGWPVVVQPASIEHAASSGVANLRCMLTVNTTVYTAWLMLEEPCPRSRRAAGLDQKVWRSMRWLQVSRLS